jgi:PAS domain S-box-containing protein
VVGVARIDRDVTERIEYARLLEHSERRHRQLVETANEGVWAIDGDGITTFVNARMAAMLGWEAEEMLGRSVMDFTVDTSVAADRIQRRSGIDAEQFETMLLHRGGTEVPVLISTSALREADGALTGSLGMVIDMTERKRAEAEAAKFEAQLHQIQKLETVGQLAGGIAHDFNNLLGVILNYAEFVTEALEGHPAREDVREITHAAERAADLTQQLLVFSRRDMATTEALDVNDLMTDFERLMRRTLGEDIGLRIVRGADAPAIRAERSQIEQVLLNLAVNARDAMPDGGDLLIGTRLLRDDDGHWLRITVSDGGQGMTDDVIEHAFEPFFTTKPKGSGTGLGLASVYGIVTAAGGRVSIDSEVGIGTTFTIDLPAARVVAGEDTAEREALDGRQAATILVVDDEPALRRLTTRILEGGGFTVLDVDSPLKALDLAESLDGPLDLVLTDIVMPEMQGPALAEKLVSLRPEARVIFMSGYTDRPNRVPGDARFIGKPFTAEALLQQVRAELEAAGR